MKKSRYIIKRPYSEAQYLESHCQALVWKSKQSDAKIFNSKSEVEKTCKRWRINESYITKID